MDWSDAMNGRTRNALVTLTVIGAVAVFVTLGSVGRNTASADIQGVPHLEVDANPANGTRPCSPIDASFPVPASGNYQVAFCLEENAGAPDAFEVTLNYSGSSPGIVSASAGPTTGDALDANPDFNQAAGPNGNGTNWSCTGLGFALPVASPSPAHLLCNDKNFVAGELTADPGLLGTFTLTASGGGTVTLTFADGVSGVNSPAGTNLVCGVDMTCVGASILQTAATDTPTATPTFTPTPGAPTNTPTFTATPTSTGTATNSPTPTNTPNAANDVDGDGIADLTDNCPYTFNPGQTDTKIGPIDNGPGHAQKDVTVPNEDNLGDACDSDRDNDGLPDLAEVVGCGFGPTDPGTAALDDTYDDNHDGNPAAPLGTDLADDGPSWDTDADGVPDGVECQLGSNPNDRNSRPAPLPGDGNDDDGDGVLNGWERNQGTNPQLIDTDGDGKSDCQEIADVDGNGFANYTGDVIEIAHAAVTPGAVRSGVMDENKDGIINFTTDVIFAAKVAVVPGFCPAVPAPIPGDFDRDGLADAADNCARVFNPSQLNTALPPFDNGPSMPGDDPTVPNQDNIGDACDPDTDNDTATDVQEAIGCNGSGSLDAGVPFVDVSYDDNHNANAAPNMGSDGFDDGPSADTDADGVLDGYECAHASNPKNISSRPPALPDDAQDSDGDGLLNGWERRGWGTDPNKVDTDGDGLGDCKEAADVDGNGNVNFTNDTIAVAKAAVVPGFGRNGTFDINKDGIVNFTTDVIESARRALGVTPCL